MDFESTIGSKSPLPMRNIIWTKPSKLSIRLGKNIRLFKVLSKKLLEEEDLECSPLGEPYKGEFSQRSFIG